MIRDAVAGWVGSRRTDLCVAVTYWYHMTHLTAENTTVVGHRVAGDSLMFDCPDCEFGEVPLTALIERGAGRCLDCGARFRLRVERIDDGGMPAEE
jgi:hypothetical protein